jgi:hypothetical protein
VLSGRDAWVVEVLAAARLLEFGHADADNEDAVHGVAHVIIWNKKTRCKRFIELYATHTRWIHIAAVHIHSGILLSRELTYR